MPYLARCHVECFTVRYEASNEVYTDECAVQTLKTSMKLTKMYKCDYKSPKITKMTKVTKITNIILKNNKSHILSSAMSILLAVRSKSLPFKSNGNSHQNRPCHGNRLHWIKQVRE